MGRIGKCVKETALKCCMRALFVQHMLLDNSSTCSGFHKRGPESPFPANFPTNLENLYSLILMHDVQCPTSSPPKILYETCRALT